LRVEPGLPLLEVESTEQRVPMRRPGVVWLWITVVRELLDEGDLQAVYGVGPLEKFQAVVDVDVDLQ